MRLVTGFAESWLGTLTRGDATPGPLFTCDPAQEFFSLVLPWRSFFILAVVSAVFISIRQRALFISK